MDERNLEELDFEDMSNIIVLNDEFGNEVEFEFVDLIEYEGEEYIVLLPMADDDGEVVILRIEPIEGNDEEETYVGVEDEDILNAVFSIFKEKFADEFHFAD